MILFNLLPWREAQRRARKHAFTRIVSLLLLLAAAIVILISGINVKNVSSQVARNNLLKQENAALDLRIREVAGLRQEIDALKARQSSVEVLQANRNQPVYLMDELVTLVPAGVILKSLRQADKITLAGYAQSNARISELLRNLGNDGRWLAQPELVEIKSAIYGQGKDQRRLVEFTLSVNMAQPAKTASPHTLVSRSQP